MSHVPRAPPRKTCGVVRAYGKGRSLRGPFPLTGALTGRPPYGKAPYREASYGKAFDGEVPCRHL